jgi:molybdenum cofactor cytidylyltransferase
MIWALILAAGESKRMASPKLLLPFRKKTIIETVIGNAVASKVDHTLLVLGAHRDELFHKIKDSPVETVFNKNFSAGMLSSVQLGFRSLPEGTQAALVLLGDQPSVSSAVIDRVIEGFFMSHKGIVLPTYKKDRGHPVLIDMKYRDFIDKLSPDVGLRGVVYSHPEDVFEVEVDTPAILRDIDTRDDYNREIKKTS